MKTISFIGSSKNAGKTTSLQIYIHHLQHKHPHLILTSIGINGEHIDQFTHMEKPQIIIPENTLFITASSQLTSHIGLYRIIDQYILPDCSDPYILAQAITPTAFTIQGPNTKESIIILKKHLQKTHPQYTLLIDGSIDRCFLADPKISNQLMVTLKLHTTPHNCKQQQRFKHMMSIPSAPSALQNMLTSNITPNTKSMLLDDRGHIIYDSHISPCMDKKLHQYCAIYALKPCTLFINGALTMPLFQLLANFSKLRIVLNYFTLLHAAVSEMEYARFQPMLFTLHSSNIKCIFLNQSKTVTSMNLPAHIPTYNLFREDLHDISI